MPRNLVLTPGGYRHPSLVHRVDPGHALDVAGGKARLMNLTTKAFVNLPEVSVQPGDVPGFGSGWITYGYWLNTTGNPVTSFSTTWQVPAEPATQSGQTVFLFSGIDPSNPSDAILQPVLQWGSSAAGGGAYWLVASWYVLGGGQAFHTTPVPVNVGDTLVGVMTLTGQSGSMFSYNCEFQGIAGTSLPVQNVVELVWCNETLEAYSITKCSDYPDADFTAMWAINMQTGKTTPALNWTPMDKVTDCGQHTIVRSNSATEGEVDLYFRNRLLYIPWDRFAKEIRILFGVTNDGGGIGILPNGRIIHIPPGDPVGALFGQVSVAMTDVVRGFAVLEDVQGSDSASKAAIGRATLELMAKALESAVQAVKKTSSESSIG
jgi:hypothetical protein